MTPFFKDNYRALGRFFDHAELITRVIVLDNDPQEIHDAMEAARHLADRHDLRFALTTDVDVMKTFDNKYKYLRNNMRKDHAFEALALWNHDDTHLQMGLHHHHDHN